MGMPATVVVLRKGGEAARPPLSISTAHEGEKKFRRELLVGTSVPTFSRSASDDASR
jgi:hypothetical protein